MGHFQNLQNYYSYSSFMELMQILVIEGKTTGPVQSESLVYFTRLNLQRYNRWQKTFELNEDVAAGVKLIQPQIWWVINEAWCGDAAQTLPVIRKMEEASLGKIELRIILRDEHTEIMDQYLTNGGRSIPKLVSEDKEGNELFTWGPRPAIAQKMMMDWKSAPDGRTLDEMERELHLWYTKDTGQSVQQEFLLLFHNMASTPKQLQYTP